MNTVNDLIRQVRFNVQEANTSQVSDQMILDTLNRAKDYAYSNMAKHYLDPLLKEETVKVSGISSIAVPKKAFEDRVVRVECRSSGNSTWNIVKKLTFASLGKFSHSGVDQLPTAWALVGRDITFPNKVGACEVRIWYLEDTGKLVTQQGRIDDIVVSTDTSRPFITVDEVGSDVVISDTYKKYVSVVDSTTGEIKTSLQVEQINEKQLLFRSAPTRTSVLNVDIETETKLDESVIELDDYICSIGGTCVVYFPRPVENFIIQYATNEIRDTLGTLKSGQNNRLDKLEKDITNSKSGRENTKRVRNKSPIWKRARLRRNIK